MPVNWAFPAAQGEPESFLYDPGFDLRLQRVLVAAGFLAAQKFLSAIGKSIPRINVLISEFLHA
jgi:hypothetical protein